MELAKRLVQAKVQMYGEVEYERMRAKYDTGAVSEDIWLAWLEARRPVATESTSKGSPIVAEMVDPKAKKYAISS